MGNPFLTLVLDQGGHASRALVFNAQGNKLAEASIEVHTYRQADRVELDAIELINSLRKVALDVCDQLGDDRCYLRAAGLATQRSNMLCWRRSDRQALSPVLSWQDRRAEDKVKASDRARIQQKTGLFANAHYGASKMAWCLEHIAEVKLAAEQNDLCIGPMASYLASCLTDTAAVADPVNASRTLLWNIHDKNWDDELCQLFGIDRSFLPTCVSSDYGFGSLILHELEVPLNIVTGDLSAAAFVNGTPLEDTTYITLGTGAFVQRITHKPHSPSSLLESILWQSKEQQIFSLEGTVNGSGSAITWLATQHNIEEKQVSLHLQQWLNEVNDPPLFLNAVSGIGSPIWCAHEISRFNREASLAEQAVAVLDSIVFLLILNMQVMEELIPGARCINVSGGLASIDGLCQKLADLSELPVQRNDEIEATARGLAFLLGNNQGEWSAKFTVFEPRINTALASQWSNWLDFVRDNVTDHCQYFSDKSQSSMVRQSLIAHRGQNSTFPENTLESIQAAIECGATAVEFDVQMSADYVPVVCHDISLLRTAGVDINIAKTKYVDLKKISVAERKRFADKFQFISLPALQDMVSLLKVSPKVRVFVELKDESIEAFGKELFLEKVMSQLQTIQAQCVVIANDLQVLTALKKQQSISVGWIIHRWEEADLKKAEHCKVDFLVINHKYYQGQSHAFAKDSWRWVMYETSDPDKAIELLKQGVHLVETNDICAMLNSCQKLDGVP